MPIPIIFELSRRGRLKKLRKTMRKVSKTKVTMKKKCQRLLVTNIKAKSVVSPSRNDIINLKNIILRRSVGVKARNYKIVDKSTGNEYEFASGTHIQNAEVFAGKEQNTLFTNVFQKNLSKK